MKVLIIRKKQILIFSFFIILIISTLILLRIPKTDINVIAPIEYGKSTSIDLNGDNIEDTIEIISNDGFDDEYVLIATSKRSLYIK